MIAHYLSLEPSEQHHFKNSILHILYNIIKYWEKLTAVFLSISKVNQFPPLFIMGMSQSPSLQEHSCLQTQGLLL